jgi:hypothetical protein
MAEAKRKRRWLLWCSAVALGLTLAAAGFSEVAGLSWRESAGDGAPNRFVLYKSTVTVVWRFGDPEKVTWLGHELFDPGWSVVRSIPTSVFGRRWKPEASRSVVLSTTRWHMVVPLWIPAVVFGAGIWWSVRGGWTGPGTCKRCGYDVRGVPGNVCPECGRPTAA